MLKLLGWGKMTVRTHWLTTVKMEGISLAQCTDPLPKRVSVLSNLQALMTHRHRHITQTPKGFIFYLYIRISLAHRVYILSNFQARHPNRGHSRRCWPHEASDGGQSTRWGLKWLRSDNLGWFRVKLSVEVYPLDDDDDKDSLIQTCDSLEVFWREWQCLRECEW